MTLVAVYVADHVGFARLMLSDEIAATVRIKAEELAAEMRATAPRRTPPQHVSPYADNFKVESGLDILKQDRGAAFVVNDSRYATALEVGSWNISNPPRPMTRVLEGHRAV